MNMSSHEYDESAHLYESSKPIRYHMTDSKELYQSRMGPFDVNASNGLRATPTRLNHTDYPSTPLFGTAPLKARNAGPVDIESQLIQGNRFFLPECDRAMVTEHDYFQNHVQLPFPIATHNVTTEYGVSTRAEFRNNHLNSK